MKYLYLLLIVLPTQSLTLTSNIPYKPLQRKPTLTLRMTTGPGIHFFNNAGSSPSPPCVTDAIISHLNLETQMGGYHAASMQSGALLSVKQQVVKLVNAESTLEIALVESATVAWTRVFYSMVHTIIAGQQPDSSNQVLERVILLSEAEYAANVVAILKFAREQNQFRTTTNCKWSVYAIPSLVDKNGLNTGIVDLKTFRSMLNGTWEVTNDLAETVAENLNEKRLLDPASIAMVCVTHIPTNSGIINPVEDIGQIVAEYNSQHKHNKHSKLPSILYVVDACQSVGQIPVNVQRMHAHAFTATGRKYLRGPRGTGFLYVPKSIVDDLVPSHVDHASTPLAWVDSEPTLEATTKQSTLQYNYREGAQRFELWESNISTKLGLGAAIRYALDDDKDGTVSSAPGGLQSIEGRIKLLSDYTTRHLRTMKRVELFHDNYELEKDGNNDIGIPCGIITFTVKGMDAALVKDKIMEDFANGDAYHIENYPSQKGRFEVSIVPSTSTPIDSKNTNVGTLVRVSLSYFNTMEEIDLFLLKLEHVLSP